jgi:hypothetical protein
MLNSPISAVGLDAKIVKIFRDLSSELLEQQNRQKFCLDSDLASFKELPIGLEFREFKWKRMISYLLLLHYYPLESSVSVYMTLDLHELFGKTSTFWLSVLTDKDLFLKYLELQETLTEQQFFSGICNKKYLKETLALIQFKFAERLNKPKRIIRRKGYRDKGTLGSDSSRALKRSISEDFYLTLAQYHSEMRELEKHNKCTLLEDFLKKGRVLTDEQKIEFRLKKGVNLNENSTRESSVEDYCKRRANEDLIEQERKDREAAERTRIQAFEAEIFRRPLTEEERREFEEMIKRLESRSMILKSSSAN